MEEKLVSYVARCKVEARRHSFFGIATDKAAVCGLSLQNTTVAFGNNTIVMCCPNVLVGKGVYSAYGMWVSWPPRLQEIQNRLFWDHAPSHENGPSGVYICSGCLGVQHIYIYTARSPGGRPRSPRFQNPSSKSDLGPSFPQVRTTATLLRAASAWTAAGSVTAAALVCHRTTQPPSDSERGWSERAGSPPRRPRLGGPSSCIAHHRENGVFAWMASSAPSPAARCRRSPGTRRTLVGRPQHGGPGPGSASASIAAAMALLRIMGWRSSTG